MQSPLDLQRILALDLRARRFGFVMFEGSKRILDWGIYAYGKAAHASFRGRLTQLIRLFKPFLIWARHRGRKAPLDQGRSQDTSGILRDVARSFTIPTRIIGADRFPDSCMHGTRTNKHELATEIASRFPALSWRLPGKRALWQSEPARQLIFDTAWVGLCYFAQQDTDRPGISLT